VTGVSTYNIMPARAGLYFNKIQCFCFEEQRLRPNEEIDMPVFFYVDPAFLSDPAMESVKSITLSYTFFRTGEQEVTDIADEIKKKEAGSGVDGGKLGMGVDGPTSERVKRWTEEVAIKAGLGSKLPGGAPVAAAAGAGVEGKAVVPSTAAA
jgi:hypothetical protein